MSNRLSRRRYLAGTGAAVTVGALAGCADDEEPAEEMLEPPAAVDDFLTENDATGYDGSMADATGEDELDVDVGSGEIGFGFSPVAVEIDVGTTVTFEWTGEGGAHNIVAAEESEIDVDVEEERIDEAGYAVDYTFDEAGTYLYVCEPHVANGKVAAIVIS